MSTPAVWPGRQAGARGGFGGRMGMSMPAEKPKDFRNTVRRLRRRLRPEQVRIVFVVTMTSASVGFTVFGPKNPRQRDRRSLQRRHRQATACRHDQAAGDRALAIARGEGQLAEMVRGMSLTPGVGSRLRASRQAPRLGGARVRAGARAELGAELRHGRRGTADRVPHAGGRRGKARPSPAALFRHSPPRRHLEPCHQ